MDSSRCFLLVYFWFISGLYWYFKEFSIKSLNQIWAKINVLLHIMFLIIRIKVFSFSKEI